MKCAYYVKVGSIEIRDDLPKPTIKPDEVLIKVKYCGICGSGVESFKSGGLYLPGIIIGHEFTGEIVKVGENVKKWKIGNRVTANPNVPCFDCYWCLHHQENMCKYSNNALGTTQNGAMAEFINVRAERLHLLPESISFETGATVEPLAVAVYAVQESGLKVGDNAAVFGAGTIGLMTIQVLKAAGAKNIFVIEPVESKQKRALKLGADKVLIPKNWNKITRLTNRVGPDHVFDAVGIPETIMTSLQLVKRGGHVTMIGMHSAPFEMKNFLALTTGNITMRGVYAYNQDHFRTAISLLEQEKVNVEPMITKRIKLDDVPKAFELLSNPPHEEIKILVKI
ncbi:MAG: zinc-dependent alcohol dehydrogenase [Promethearchaeota archaeon]